MVTRAITVLLLVLGGVLLTGPASAGEIQGHVFDDDGDGIYDPGIDMGRTGPEYGVLLFQIGDTMPGGPPPGGPWFAPVDADGFYEFTGLPDTGIFQLELPSLDPIVFYGQNIVTTDLTTGMKTAMPVPTPPDGIVAMPPTPTVVDIPILGAVAPAFVFASPPIPHIVGGVFVDANTAGQTGGGGFSRRGNGSTHGPQFAYGEVADGIEIMLQCIDASGQPVGTALTTVVGSPYTFLDPLFDPAAATYTQTGIFMFLTKALTDGESVEVSIDPTQPALDGFLPVSQTTIVRTLDLGEAGADDQLPVIEFRFQPVYDLDGRVKVIDTQGVERGMPGVTLMITELFSGMVVDTVTTDANGNYTFPDLFNAVYRIEVESSGGKPMPSGIRFIDDAEPDDLDFCFDQSNCPDGVAPTISLPANIVQECGSASGNVISWAATATDDFTPDDQILISYAPVQPGATFTTGTTVITVTAIDWCGNTSTGTFSVTVEDTTEPTIACVLPRTILWPPRHGMRPISLTASASDVCDGDVNVVVTVFSDESGGVPPFSPDATGATIADLRLRAEREGTGDGRVYLMRITATDRAGNTAIVCKCCCVPRAPIGRFILDVLAQSADAESECMGLDPDTGIPEGFEEILRIDAAPQPQ